MLLLLLSIQQPDTIDSKPKFKYSKPIILHLLR